ncbi:MAG: hypothetical protein KatS3mg035_2024 [Bacteroidia bacterium]|nr:MAG: hypothetical protein KatS3mg035_2024 [Bacteroidia bacterium]
MKKLLLLKLTLLLAFHLQAQRKCATMEVHERMLNEHPEYHKNIQEIEEFTQRMILSGNYNKTSNIITIPVVVHVVYYNSTQNISDAQIQSQIDVLNADFRNLNSDKNNRPSLFAGLAADIQIEFCLAKRTPTGAATNGIIRKSTTVNGFSTDDKVKYSSTGGSDAWDRNKYLNIWVCALTGGVLGYAQFPGGPAATDGVVIDYRYFGTIGTATAPFNKGRTATHEVGHWLNLRHIWGDANCGDDFVSDTPTQQTSNYGCPTFPKPSCGNTSDMFMNYMDYVDDACMNMFTAGQSSRMRALFATGGARVSLATSDGCVPPSSSPTYCSSKGNSVADEYIKTVTFAGINNTTGANGGYANFTNLTANVTKGSVYSITLVPGFTSSAYPEYWRVWIDFNGDMDFDDAGELAFDAGATSTTTVNGTLSIPANAVVTGNTRMRVSMKYNGAPTACETFGYGEVEDYTVNISNASSTCNVPTSVTASNITTNSATISWTAVSGAVSYTVQYKTSSATTWSTATATTNSLNLTGLSASTTYNVQVRTNCSSNSSNYSSAISFTTSAPSTSCPSDAYEANNSSSAAKTLTPGTTITAYICPAGDIDWYKVSTTSTYKNIRVTLSNLPADYDLYLYNSSLTLLSKSENGSTTSETVKYNGTGAATYYIRVIGYNNATSTSPYKLLAQRSSSAYRLAENSDEDIVIESVLQVYPNPAQNNVNLKFLATENQSVIQVIDMNGKLVFMQSYVTDLGENEVNIDTQNLSNGTYLVRVLSGENEFQQKLLIQK